MNRATIFEALTDCLPADATVINVAVGIFWTFVQTQYGSAISATAHRWCEDPPGAIIPCAGNITGMNVRELTALYQSQSLTARSLANAAVAASFDPHAMTGAIFPGKAQSLLEDICARATRKKHIALIGHFHFADALKNLGHTLDIYELEGRCAPGDIPNTQIPQRLRYADIVVMTSSTLITHATESILAASRPDAFKMIVGPTVPIHPLLWQFGFDAICASIITDPEQVARTAIQGGNHKQMTGAAKLNYLRP